MFVQSSGRGFGSVDPAASTSTRKTRAGWWFWYPLLFGVFFILGGLGFFAGAAAEPVASGGLGFTGIVFLVIGVGSLLVARWAWKDIHSEDAPKQARGNTTAALEAELRTTGVSGQATIQSFKYLGASAAGSTLVELHLTLTTTLGGTVPMVTQSRVPLNVADHIGPGATVPVIVSSTDPSKMIVEWVGLLPATTPTAPVPPAPAPPPG
jgi:hypothetical protein